MADTYAAALAWLYAYADFERGTGIGGGPPFERGLERTSRLLADLGDPHDGLRIVHVAGSKGKGSVCALVAAAAEAAGLRTGLYTQPHLHTFRERFQIDGEPIDPASFTRLVARARVFVERTCSATLGDPTTFEISTAMALAWFRMQAVDLAILEVGLGGRLDATNVVSPDVTAVTTIVREHARLLGDTLPAIAREKAAIAKPDVPMLVSDQSTEVLNAIRDVAVAAGADIQVVPALATDGSANWRDGRATTIARDPHSSDTLPLGLAGPHQARNAGLAYAVCRALGDRGVPIPRDAIRAGFAATRWPGRLELVANDPPVVVDGAHTVEAVEVVVETLRRHLNLRRGPVIFGALRDKSVRPMAEALRPYATRLLVIEPGHPRAMPSGEVLNQLDGDLGATSAPNAAAALALARDAAQPRQAVLATGSLAVAADIRAAAGVPVASDPPVLVSP
ncbi:MAG: bifunctional folylpolyglutamate synthase/dihydrofolate synthase [Chloroflexi bacterium]|nr:bifunctional folylpolyglutamate synthase/dihydrofolate synthase [Chloroflexota bacterium]